MSDNLYRITITVTEPAHEGETAVTASRSIDLNGPYYQVGCWLADALADMANEVATRVCGGNHWTEPPHIETSRADEDRETAQIVADRK